MLILIGLAVLMLAALSIGEFSGCEEFSFTGILFGGLLLITALTIPINRIDCRQDMRYYEALKETIKESRSIADVSHGVERAAIITEVVKMNAWLKDAQYWNNTLFGIWVPDTVDALQPLK